MWVPCALRFSLFVAVKTEEEEKEANNPVPEPGTSRHFWVISLLFLGQWGPPRLCSPVCCVHVPEQWKSGKLHDYIGKLLITNA